MAFHPSVMTFHVSITDWSFSCSKLVTFGGEKIMVNWPFSFPNKFPRDFLCFFTAGKKTFGERGCSDPINLGLDSIKNRKFFLETFDIFINRRGTGGHS